MRAIYLVFLILFSVKFALAENQPVNSLIGDDGYRMITGVYPHKGTSEKLRVKYHLLYAEYLLRSKDVSHLSAIKKRRRKRILDYLHAYALAGKYQKNFDFKNERLYFIHI